MQIKSTGMVNGYEVIRAAEKVDVFFFFAMLTVCVVCELLSVLSNYLVNFFVKLFHMVLKRGVFGDKSGVDFRNGK